METGRNILIFWRAAFLYFSLCVNATDSYHLMSMIYNLNSK